MIGPTQKNTIGKPIAKGGVTDKRVKATPSGKSGVGGVGKGSGEVGSGYAYVIPPKQRVASGNFGGGYAYIDGRKPSGAKPRG